MSGQKRKILGSCRMLASGRIEVIARVESRTHHGEPRVGDVQDDFTPEEIRSRGWRLEPFPERPGDEGSVLAVGE